MWLIIGIAAAVFFFVKITKSADIKTKDNSGNNYPFLETKSRQAEKLTEKTRTQSTSDDVFFSLIRLHPEGNVIDFDRTLKFNYTDSYKRKSTRTVKFEKAFSAEKTYIYGFCRLRSEPRMFKISGMSEIFDEKTKKMLSKSELKNLILDYFDIIY